MKIITNNDLISELNIETEWIEGSSLDVLLYTRNYIHKGYQLMSSPLPASIRTIMSPVKTIIISDQGDGIHEPSLFQMEAAIEKHQLINKNRGEDRLNEQDYKVVDKELTKKALEELGNYLWR